MFTLIKNLMYSGLFLLVSLLASSFSHAENSNYQPSFSNKPASAIPEYIVGIHPLHNPMRLMELYGPIVDYMNTHISTAHFKLEASRNYEEFEKKLYAGHFDFAMPNPYQTLQALKHGYRIFGKMGDDEVFRGIILVPKDSTVREVTDLKGKKVAYPAQTALAATMMPQYFFQTHGIDVNRDIENIYVGSQESSIMNVLRGHVAAGVTWSVPWQAFSNEHPDIASQLRVQWQTEPLLNNGWVVRNDVPAAITEEFARLLFSLQDSEQGKAILARLPISHFEAANDETYRPVHDFLESFSKTVRKIDY